MTFLHPILLAAGLACVAVPIVIHFLMRRRRRPVRWAAMRFLVEAYRQQKRRLRLEQLLLLALRCLLVALIAFALARPIAGHAGLIGPGPRTVYLVIDDSLTSAATDDAGVSSLARHKRAADAILASLDSARGDRAALVTLSAPAEPVVVPPSPDLGAMRRLVEHLTPTDAAADLAGALSRIAADIGPEGPDRPLVAVFSDFLAGSVRDAERLPELPRRATLAATPPAPGGAANVAVVGVEPLRHIVIAGAPGPESAGGPAGSTQVRVDLARFGPGVAVAGVTRVRLVSEAVRAGESIAVGETVVRWSPGQSEGSASVPVELSLLGSALRDGGSSVVVRAEIDRDAVPGDDARRVVIGVRDELRVAVVGVRRGAGRPTIDAFAPADWVRLALEPATDRFGAPSGRIRVAEIDPRALDTPRLAGVDAAVVVEPDALDAQAWARLRAFADGGGLVIVTPAPREGAQIWPDLMLPAFGLDWTVEREPHRLIDAPIAPDRPAGSPLDLLGMLGGELPHLAGPVRVQRIIAAHAERSAGHTALALADGTPLVLVARPGEGTENESSRGVVVFVATAFDLEWTDLPARPLMVPLVQELVRQGIGRAGGAWTTGAGALAPGPASASELRASDGASVAMDQGRTTRPLRRAGAWRAVDRDGVTRGVVVVNPDTRASRTESVAPDEIRRWLASGTHDGEVRLLDGADTPDTGETARALANDRPTTPLSLPLLIAAALVALAELAAARWASHATIARAGAEVGE